MIVSSTNVLIAAPPLSSRCTSSPASSELLRRPGVHDAALVEHDDVARDRRDDAEVLLDEQHGRQLATPLEHPRDLGDERRREALRRLVDEQHAVVVQQRAGDRDHLLLAAGERAGALPPRVPQLREELVDEVVARARRCARRAGGSPRRSARRRRRGPRARSRRRGGRSGGSASRVDVLAVERDAAAARPTRPRIARSVVVLPTPLRPSSAVTPPSGTSKDTPCRTCEPARWTCRSRERSSERASQRLPQVRLLHGRVRHDRLRACRTASSAPWCMTAIRSARPVTTSMWCSTISTVFPRRA